MNVLFKTSLLIFQSNGLGIDEFNQVELMSSMAMFDTMIIVWKEKRRWDAVRPFTAIKYLYDKTVRLCLHTVLPNVVRKSLVK